MFGRRPEMSLNIIKGGKRGPKLVGSVRYPEGIGIRIGGRGEGAAEVSFNLISTHDDDGHARFNSEIRKIDEWNCSIRRILKRGMRLRIIGDVFQFGRLEWRF